jgi:hypothetical protein
MNQQFLGPSGDTKGTILVKSNVYKCIDLAGGDTTNGNGIEVWDCNEQDNQQWSYDSR